MRTKVSTCSFYFFLLDIVCIKICCYTWTEMQAKSSIIRILHLWLISECLTTSWTSSTIRKFFVPTICVIYNPLCKLEMIGNACGMLLIFEISLDLFRYFEGVSYPKNKYHWQNVQINESMYLDNCFILFMFYNILKYTL